MMTEQVIASRQRHDAILAERAAAKAAKAAKAAAATSGESRDELPLAQTASSTEHIRGTDGLGIDAGTVTKA